MKIQIIVCDKCGRHQSSETEKFFRPSVFHERRSNGIENENYNWEMDLCPDCAQSFIIRICSILPNILTAADVKELVRSYNAKSV